MLCPSATEEQVCFLPHYDHRDIADHPMFFRHPKVQAMYYLSCADDDVKKAAVAYKQDLEWVGYHILLYASFFVMFVELGRKQV